MFGLMLVFISAIFTETGASIGKHEIQLRKESIYSLGFLSLLWGTTFFFAQALTTPSSFSFSFASLPTFLTRFVFELAVAYCTVHAVARADRSTFGFLRTITIPLLLVVDVVIGYAVSPLQIAGICIIVASFIILFINHGIRKRGAVFVVCSALLAVVTISLYKYDITHFNSVVAEQGSMSALLMVYYYAIAKFKYKENPLRLLKNPAIFIQSLSAGVGHVFMSFAYLFAPASVIASANRSFNVVVSVLSGKFYFKEKKMGVKLIAFLFMAAGITLLAF